MNWNKIKEGDVLDKKNLPKTFSISMFPTVSLENEQTLNSLLDVFELYNNLIPTHWGNNETIRLNYDKQEIVEQIVRKQPRFSEIHLHRTTEMKYNGYFSLDGSNFRSFLTFNFTSLPQAQWPILFELSERLAEIVKPRYGNTHIYWPSTIPWTTDLQKYHRWMNFSAQIAPVNFGPRGPLGLGLRTYFNNELVELLGRDVLQNMPALICEKEWGGVQIDITEKPWESSPDQLLDSWLKATDHLEATEILAVPNYSKDKRTVTFAVNKKWKEFIDSIK
ncbi:hypothetical protein [Paenibacillus glacialis]|uniref:Uncharacterized protein n=1 Tax=Paenibacillus glacialis TaxID=494026 RepID=A0A168H3H7_9BACL|nr:hypothetical protein [Paenibacillus glacialis]OAB37780.1 hypothetical protein PGLA_20625 [Paenibacillus glacialis]